MRAYAYSRPIRFAIYGVNGGLKTPLGETIAVSERKAISNFKWREGYYPDPNRGGYFCTRNNNHFEYIIGKETD